MELYREKDIQIVTENIDKIVKEHKKQKFLKVKVTKKEYDRNTRIVLQFIRNNKNIIYGGYAQDQLLKSKNKEGIYNQYSNSDIEFYSPTPLKDIIKISQIFHEKKFGGALGIRITEAQHEGTYTLFINGHGYCDVTFMPSYIYKNIPIIFYKTFKFIHPIAKTIDFYREFTDPLLSYWRFSDKSTFSRFKKNLKAFKTSDLINISKLKPNLEYLDEKISKKIRDLIVKNGQSTIIVGSYAFNYFLNFDKSKPLNVTYYELISVNYIEDLMYFRTELNKLVDKKSKIEGIEYYPFFQYYHRKIEFYITKNNKKTLLLVLYQSKDICLPYKNLPSKNLDIGSFQLTLLYSFINYLYYYIYQNKDKKFYYSYMIVELLKRKNSYLTSKKKTVLDDTPFKEFIFNCKGEAVDFGRKSRIQNTYKRQKRGFFSYSYDPSKDSEPNYEKMDKYKNISGDKIINLAKLTINRNR
jgi:hypothetical protein